jgi:antitoxin component HigA of HigAB toxin-antitoxin module
MIHNFINHTLSRLIKLAALPGGGSSLPELGNFELGEFGGPWWLYKGMTPLEYATEKTYNISPGSTLFMPKTLFKHINENIKTDERLLAPENRQNLPRQISAGWDLFLLMHELDQLDYLKMQFLVSGGTKAEKYYERFYRFVPQYLYNLEPILRGLLLSRYGDYVRYLDLQGVKLKILEDLRFEMGRGRPYSLIIGHPENGLVKAVFNPTSKAVSFQQLSPSELYRLSNILYSELTSRAYKIEAAAENFGYLAEEAKEATATRTLIPEYDWLRPIEKIENYSRQLEALRKPYKEVIGSLSEVNSFLTSQRKPTPEQIRTVSQTLYKTMQTAEQLSETARNVASKASVQIHYLNYMLNPPERGRHLWDAGGILPISTFVSAGRSAAELHQGNLLATFGKSEGIFAPLEGYKLPIVGEHSLQYSDLRYKGRQFYSLDLATRPIEMFRIGSNPHAWRFLRIASRLARR